MLQKSYFILILSILLIQSFCQQQLQDQSIQSTNLSVKSRLDEYWEKVKHFVKKIEDRIQRLQYPYYNITLIDETTQTPYVLALDKFRVKDLHFEPDVKKFNLKVDFPDIKVTLDGLSFQMPFEYQLVNNLTNEQDLQGNGTVFIQNLKLILSTYNDGNQLIIDQMETQVTNDLLFNAIQISEIINQNMQERLQKKLDKIDFSTDINKQEQERFLQEPTKEELNKEEQKELVYSVLEQVYINKLEESKDPQNIQEQDIFDAYEELKEMVQQEDKDSQLDKVVEQVEISQQENQEEKKYSKEEVKKILKQVINFTEEIEHGLIVDYEDLKDMMKKMKKDQKWKEKFDKEIKKDESKLRESLEKIKKKADHDIKKVKDKFRKHH